MRLRQSYHLYAGITVVLWSLSYVFTRLALQSFSPFSLGLLRYFFASCFLAVVLLITKSKWPKRQALGPLILSGACGFFLYMVTFNLGSQTVTAATSCTVIATAPLITMLLARIICKERLTPLQYVSAFLSFLGVAVLTIWNMRLSTGRGLFYIFAAAVLLSIYNLLQRRLTKQYSPLQVTGFSIFFGTILLGVFTPNALCELPAAPGKSIGYVVILGVFCGAIAYCCWTKALSLASDTASVSNYMFVEPFLTAVFGLLIAKERLELSTIVGGCIILLGMFLYYFGERLLPHLSKCRQLLRR